MNKRVLSGVIAAALMCATVGGLAACSDGGKEPHSHTVSTDWSYDEFYHYHSASCGWTNHREDVELHQDGACFCGYNSGETPVTPSTPGTFGNMSVSKTGVLKFGKIKGASKYVLKATYSGAASPSSYDIDKSKTSVDLSTLEADGFPTGKTTVELTAYEIEEVEIDGEKFEQEVPMTGVSETFRIIKLNGAYSLVRLAYKDDYISLDGFVPEAVDGGVRYVYELKLKGNKATSFNASKHVTAGEDCAVKYYKSKEGRDGGDTSDEISSNDFKFESINHGERTYYARSVDANGTAHDYDLCVIGLYELTVGRYNATYTDSNGTRNYSYSPIGNKMTVTERDIIAADALYDGVDSGKLCRSGDFTLYEKADTVITSATPELSLYFYDADTVEADCAEYETYSEYFRITVSDYYMALSSYNITDDGSVTVPHKIAGTLVGSCDMSFNYDLTTLCIEEGATAFVVKFGPNNSKLTDIYLPSTIASMNRFAFGENEFTKIPSSTVIHCAFSADKAAAFDRQWNQIPGGYKTYNTVYDGASQGGGTSSQSGGLIYKLEGDTLTVTAFEDKFKGVIPDTAEFGGATYNVTKIEIELYNRYKGKLTIGANVAEIANGAVTGVESVELSAQNQNFVYENGMLLSKDKTRLLAVDYSLTYFNIPETVTEIDSYALYFDGKNRYVATRKTEDEITLNGNRIEQNSQFYYYDDITYLVRYGEEENEAKTYVVKVDGDEVNIRQTVDGVPVNQMLFLDVLADFSGTAITLPIGLFDSNNWGGLGGLDCSNITELNLVGPSDYTLDKYSFSVGYKLSSFTSLERINVSEECGGISSYDGVVYDKAKTKMLYVPKYISGKVTVAEGVTVIDGAIRNSSSDGYYYAKLDSSFFDCPNITEIVLPDTLEEIDQRAFGKCTSLTTVILPKTVKKVGEKAFYGCISLTDVTIQNGFRIGEGEDALIYKGIFECCGALTSIKFDGTIAEHNQTLRDNNEYQYEKCMYPYLSGSYVKTVVCTDGTIEIDHT